MGGEEEEAERFEDLRNGCKKISEPFLEPTSSIRNFEDRP